MKYLPLNPEIFISNRQRFLKQMRPNAIAIFVSNDEFPVNGDALYPFKQNSDLFWLSGIVQEDSMLILFPDNPDPKYREVLVLNRPNELKEKWDGKRLRTSEAQKISGIKTIVWMDNLDALLQQAIDITENTFRRLLKFIRPGVMEFEIEAEIWHSFLSQRATGPAYGSIIAGGDRARTLHYVRNDQECRDGELILMDFGAEYG